jgi:hypothetical protein
MQIKKIILIFFLLPALLGWTALPYSLKRFKNLRKHYARKPLGAVKMFIIALLVHQKKTGKAQEMLTKMLDYRWLKKHKNKRSGYTINNTFKILLRQLRKKGGHQIIPSYVLGATPANKYQIDTDKKIKINFAYPKNKIKLYRATIYLKSSGASQPRRLKLRRRGKYWRIAECGQIFLPLTHKN